MNIRGLVRALFRRGKALRCVSCKATIPDDQVDQACAVEVEAEVGGRMMPVYAVCCSELCLKRVNVRGVSQLVVTKIVDGEL